MQDFVHLHLHSEYSLLDGACRINGIISRAKELGQKSVAITDHGVMYAAIDFYKLAKKEGIKPIIGCEVYTAARTRHDRMYHPDSEHGHLVLLCKDMEGYHNLVKLVSTAWIDGFYGKPRVDWELLTKYNKGLIALSACLSGEIPRLLLANDYEGAKQKALAYNSLFGEGNYYLELQDHGIPEQKAINPQIVRISRETGIPLVATNDVHYLKKEDAYLQRVLLCIQTNKTVDDPNGVGFPTEEFYMKSGDEMASLFPEYPEAIENTVKIAEKCNIEFTFGKTILPHFEVPGNQSHYEYFRNMCIKGLKEKYGENPDEKIVKRLEYELETINRMGYVDYYLIVQDFVRYAKSVGIPVGPGRGSGAGSLCAYCIGITGIDPIKYNLLFERFLNPERVSMPDFDIDFCYVRRQEVINYVVRKYGSDHVSQIITFGTMAARAAIRDVGRVMNFSYAETDKVAKLIPSELNITIDKALSMSPELKSLYDSDERIRKLIDVARGLEGMPRHASMHAAGVVITRDPVDTYVPLQKNDESIVTQYTMTNLEELGLLKMDFLGLRNLTVIRYAEDMIKEKYQPDFSIDKIPLDDKEVFEMLSLGKTEGVFQFESAGMKQVLVSLKPESIEDLIAVISLYRPGPMESIPRYIENRHHPEKITYKHPLLKDILEVTYGCIVYQEQVMEIVRKLAGYSYGRADLVRRAMAKKKTDVMQKERENFIYGKQREDGSFECVGAIRNGVSEEIANAIFDEMASFASYAFNKSHAAAYAIVAYQTAYLKCHYPKEYMAALLTSILDNTDKVSEYIGECQKLGIGILPPDINESGEGFTVSGNNIRFGLLAVKNLGRGFIKSLLDERKTNGKFTSFRDFCSRMIGQDMNKRTLESLIKCGAFDSFGYKRRQLLLASSKIISQLEEQEKINLSGQVSFFADNNINSEEIPDADEFPRRELLNQEKEVIGFYLTGHPLAEYKEFINRAGIPHIREVLSDNQRFKDGSKVQLIGIISAKQLKTTKTDSTMAFITLDDGSGQIECLVFPKTLETFRNLIAVDEIVVISGRISIREEEAPKILCDSVTKPDLQNLGTAPEKQNSKNKKAGLYISVPAFECEEYTRAIRVIEVFDGDFPLYVYCRDKKKLLRAPRKLWVSMNDVLLNELKNILGSSYVQVVN
ncbi:DNA polymerase III subunit alpha [[Clostridium] cellulosi]